MDSIRTGFVCGGGSISVGGGNGIMYNSIVTTRLLSGHKLNTISTYSTSLHTY